MYLSRISDREQAAIPDNVSPGLTIYRVDIGAYLYWLESLSCNFVFEIPDGKTASMNGCRTTNQPYQGPQRRFVNKEQIKLPQNHQSACDGHHITNTT